MNNKIALAMISKGTGDEPKHLRQCLESASPHVDGIFITFTSHEKDIPEAVAVAREFKATVSYYLDLFEVKKEVVEWTKTFFGRDPALKEGDKLFLFDEARNFNLAQIPKEYGWILWLDTDDTLMHGEKLRDVVTNANQNGFKAVYFNYIYEAEFDAEGKIKNIMIEHLRERLITNEGLYKWVSPIHETLIEQTPTSKTDNYDCMVLHHASQLDRRESLGRNIKNLELAVYQSKGKDPRHIYYLAKLLYDLLMIDDKTEHIDLTTKLLFEYLWGEDKSGWPEERAQACEYLANVYVKKGEFNNAIKSLMNGLIESPYAKSLMLGLASTYTRKGDWERGIFWVKQAYHLEEKKTTLVKNPRDYQLKTLEVIYNCSVNMGKIDEAWAACQRMLDFEPQNQQFQEAWRFISSLRAERDLTNQYRSLAQFLTKNGEQNKIKPLLASAPQLIANNPYLVDLYKKNMPPKRWKDNEVAIYCGPGFTTWSPSSLSDPGGEFVGGSEEAVIRMAKALTDEGWKVTVYADPGSEEGDHEGVTYLPYYKFNRFDEFNIFVIWRMLGFVDTEMKTKKLYVWNHDIVNPLDWTEERVKKITKAFFLSKWHRDNVPALAEDKIMITSNGL